MISGREVIELSSDSEILEETVEQGPVVDSGSIEDPQIRPDFDRLLRTWTYMRYDGSRQGADARDFLERLQEQYRWYRCTPDEGVLLAEHCLVGDARTWWLSMRLLAQYTYEGTAWDRFMGAFQDQYVGSREGTEADAPESSTAPQRGHLLKISGAVQINGITARALFDTGATHSYIDSAFVATHGIPSVQLAREWVVRYANGSRVVSTRICRGCELVVGDMKTEMDVVVSGVSPWDVLVGMDWLGTHHAWIGCRQGVIEFHRPGRFIFVFRGDPIYA